MDNQVEIAAALRRAFGSMLATASAEPTTLADFADDGGQPYVAHLVRYELVDCPVVAQTFIPQMTDTGFVPPLTNYSDPPEADRMDAARFRELLRSYGKTTTRPFGDLLSYATAASRNDDGSATIAGKAWAVRDLWVITPGMSTQRQLRERHGKPESGYVFAFPPGGAPEFLGIVKALGRGPDVTD